MSVMEFDLAHRYSPHNTLSFPDYYDDDHDTPLALSFGVDARTNPRGYRIGESMVDSRGSFSVARDEPSYDHGNSRRRIAVACARCRKRKIKCSGDPGNGAGCNSCRQAGVAANTCQFHRVGSDVVHKVMDNIQMAQSLTNLANSDGVVPMYSTVAIEPTYSRPVTSPTYPPLDSKPVYPSTWTVPYSEDTSPTENYGTEQSTSYLSSAAPITNMNINMNMYGRPHRWTYPPSRQSRQTPNFYNDQNTSYTPHGLPYTYPPTTRTNARTSEPHSPMNMSSLRLTLPERPHPRKSRVTEGAVPRRQLPIPQPSPAQNSRNTLDSLQDQRLRYSQAGNTSSAGTIARDVKPQPIWGSGCDDQINQCTAMPTNASTRMPAPTEDALRFLATAAADCNAGATSSAPQIELNFTSSSLLEAMTASAPTPQYSNFRENRTLSQSSASNAFQDLQTCSYGFNSDNASKRGSTGGEDSEDCKLVDGRQYTPLTHLQPQTSRVPESLQRDIFSNRSIPLHRASLGNLNTSF